MNLETTRLTGRPRNRWKNEEREDGRLVGGKGWKERVYEVCSKSIRIGIVVVVHWVGCVCNQS